MVETIDIVGYCLDPWREESPLVSLVPEVLIQVGVCYFLQRLHVVHGDQVAVQVHELNPNLHQKIVCMYITSLFLEVKCEYWMC